MISCGFYLSHGNIQQVELHSFDEYRQFAIAVAIPTQITQKLDMKKSLNTYSDNIQPFQSSFVSLFQVLSVEHQSPLDAYDYHV